ncbi:hypothetical protein HQ325_02855 [Rhodococcus sp. BP-349]|uniref:MerR family transcriptional regulator n=1 Tax=unclassified Rhodococcus (in: high G+C Gram-positive bacteria) TaxID=192944 RepID=UPI001DAFD4CA|nr:MULTISPECIES: MerR family transcriptional regulator [unclassified Rhodococcus (in: high G+C Gram-positive bacteria)]MBY6537603.1 hypothetical protein [Rhodococcus sp. BP-363]MBY6541940.1 hypothetical protein [Rhodococcus sp. BP-369]MBY6561170.1 hypothetical protein [Rhodococcus sp. BP-370]MBY6575462.1 hypothetical protein [Rhodococcus sp. BP-364]MBY6584763.1 hypothetical protein [Rhodococcus sp. BP-358]
MPVHGLSISEFADRVGVSVNTVKSYRSKGMLPTPDVTVGTTEGWFPATVDQWMLERPGRGRRRERAKDGTTEPTIEN